MSFSREECAAEALSVNTLEYCTQMKSRGSGVERVCPEDGLRFVRGNIGLE